MATPPLKTAISDTYPNPSNATARTGFGALYDYVVSVPHGQCRLVKSGSNLVLQRYNGQWLRINDVAYSIPSAGVSLAVSGASASTVYNIYAYMNSGTMTLEFSATAHATDSTTGVEIKSGDATRTLVGKARTTAGTAWADSDTQRFVISWFNRRPVRAIFPLSANVGTTSTSYVEVETTWRVEFLNWAGDEVTLGTNGSLECSTTSTVATAVFTNGAAGTATTEAVTRATIPTSTYYAPAVTSAPITAAADGYTYAGVNGATGAGTATWHGSGTAGTRCSLYAIVQG